MLLALSLVECQLFSIYITNRYHFVKSSAGINVKIYYRGEKIPTSLGGEMNRRPQNISTVSLSRQSTKNTWMPEKMPELQALRHTQIGYPYKEKQHFNTKCEKDGFRLRGT